jgi:hypothetical protein
MDTMIPFLTAALALFALIAAFAGAESRDGFDTTHPHA